MTKRDRNRGRKRGKKIRKIGKDRERGGEREIIKIVRRRGKEKY